jgi:hypothetical protein
MAQGLQTIAASSAPARNRQRPRLQNVEASMVCVWAGPAAQGTPGVNSGDSDKLSARVSAIGASVQRWFARDVPCRPASLESWKQRCCCGRRSEHVVESVLFSEGASTLRVETQRLGGRGAARCEHFCCTVVDPLWTMLEHVQHEIRHAAGTPLISDLTNFTRKFTRSLT